MAPGLFTWIIVPVATTGTYMGRGRRGRRGKERKGEEENKDIGLYHRAIEGNINSVSVLTWIIRITSYIILEY